MSATRHKHLLGKNACLSLSSHVWLCCSCVIWISVSLENLFCTKREKPVESTSPPPPPPPSFLDREDFVTCSDGLRCYMLAICLPPRCAATLPKDKKKKTQSKKKKKKKERVKKTEAGKYACWILMSSHLLEAGRVEHQKTPPPRDELVALFTSGVSCWNVLQESRTVCRV